MKVIFAGTPEFARIALEKLHAAGFEIALVLSQPDRPAGRGLKLQASPVKQWALTHNTPVAQPRSLRLDGKYPDDAQAAKLAIADAQADVMVVAAYGLILPQWVLDTPRLGCLNIHASLLPRWRGAAPIHRAIEAGDAQTGITIMQMDAGLDTGDMLLVEKLAIAPDDTTPALHDKLAVLGGRLIVEALEIAACGDLKPQVQPLEGITYAHKIEKAEAQIDWQQSAAVIERRIRAFNPFPGASSVLNGEVIKLQTAHISGAACAREIRAGSIIGIQNQGIDVATGEGVLRITQLQKSGGKSLPVADFLRGFDLQPGMCFASAAP
ncbi:MAG: methionyl-tRNA formyltransferase [Polaromonas sp.]